MQDPQLLQFIVAIAGAAALLLWSVRLVRTGIERAFSHHLRKWLRRSAGSRLRATTSGLAAALLLQSSTAVAVLVTNFVSTGGIASAAGLAIVLGADIGSALVVQVLLQRQDFLVPLLLLTGITLFLKTPTPRARQVGRTLIGLALIFVSLDMIREATVPLADNQSLLSAMQYLGTDALMAFVIGAVFAWVVHSSVAAVLLIAAFVAQGLLPMNAAVSLVLGANLGGAFIAYILTLNAPREARRMIAANLALRGGGAALLLMCITFSGVSLAWLGSSESMQIVNLHLAFNIGLAIAVMPLLGKIDAAMKALYPEGRKSVDAFGMSSALDDSTLDRPTQALACSAREILSIGQMVETMLRAVATLYDTWDEPLAKAIEEKDAQIRKMHFELKLFLARLHRRALEDEETRQSMDHIALAANLEAASDVITRTMTNLARRLHRGNKAFSEKGRQEIEDFHDRVLSNVQLGLNVMMTQGPDAARELVSAKDDVRSIEQKLQEHHLGRLREGLSESVETSNIHQETLRALKQINSSFSMIAYPILSNSGDLLSTRLSGIETTEKAS